MTTTPEKTRKPRKKQKPRTPQGVVLAEYKKYEELIKNQLEAGYSVSDVHKYLVENYDVAMSYCSLHRLARVNKLTLYFQQSPKQDKS